MKLHRLLPLIALFTVGCKNDDTVGCKNDDPSGDPAGSRPVPTAEKQAAIDESLAGQKIGQLINDKISWFKADKYQKGGLDRAPDFYLFYYTASW